MSENIRNEEDIEETQDIGENFENNKINNEQVYNMLTNNELSWQTIIYDLINTGQLDPWDIDIGYLANKYLQKVRQAEEANFFVSSKVLLAASLLLRIKSEILLERYIRSLDDILFGKKEEKKYEVERIELDLNEIPDLYMRTPIPRMRKVSLQELMSALNKAITTENRRINKEIDIKRAEREAETVLPKTRLNVKDKIKKTYSRILTLFKHKQSKLSYTELVGKDREERIISFLPILHLDTQQRIWLEQEKHFDEIYIWLYEHYKKENADKIVKGLVKEEKEIEAQEKLNSETGFDNLIGELADEELE